jgi:hypothetical protein
MDNIKLAKMVLGTAAGFGVGTLIKPYIRAATPPDASTFTKVTTRIGGYGLGVAAGEVSANAIINQIDEIAALFGKGENAKVYNITNMS